MPYSRINSQYDFNNEKWVISLVNTGPGNGTSKIFGHAVIVVEGIKEDGSSFFGEYDIAANAAPEEQTRTQNILYNSMGYITKIRCNPKNHHEPNSADAEFDGAYRDYVGKAYSANSWYVTRTLAIEMILSIEQDALTLEKEINTAQREGRDVNWIFKYQKAGSERLSLWGGNGGNNCITWAEEKLQIARVGTGKHFLDTKMASTEVHLKCNLL